MRNRVEELRGARPHGRVGGPGDERRERAVKIKRQQHAAAGERLENAPERPAELPSHAPPFCEPAVGDRRCQSESRLRRRAASISMRPAHR